jgi:hypothetical protein
MTGQQVVKRLTAFQQGRPVPLGETLRVPLLATHDILIVCFVRMGGESAPWGIAYGQPGRRPAILTVPEPRDRDLVAEMVTEFAPALLTHLEHPAHGGRLVEGGDELALRQVWVPNPTHLEMLHNLAYAYTFARLGPAKRVETLNRLGRAAGWLFRESQRPGQTLAIAATDALKQSYTFPAEDIRLGHLGYLLAWLRTPGGRDARSQAAEEAERSSISTSLNPDDERVRLEAPLEKFLEARKARSDSGQKRWRKVIDRQLRPALESRFNLTEQAIEVLNQDDRRENAYLDVLAKASLDEQWRQYLRIERRFEDPEDGPPFVPSPETDRNPAAGASRYLVYEASAELLENLLVHDDKELQAELIAEGKAIRGTIVEVYDEDPGRRTVPIWILEADGSLPLRLRQGSDICVAGCRNREGVVRAVELTKTRAYRIEIQITRCVTVPRGDTGVLPATSPLLKGQEVTLVPTSKDGISRSKSRKVWNTDVPGRRLTHMKPAGPRAVLPEDIVERESGGM